MASDQPLLTFAVAGFNQERFIREAIEGAFAQTYSPLEIILSDDCSRDRTFEIMREMAAAYRGPHRIVLNRNDSQRSIGGHVNRLVELAKGALIVGAAGDDISLPLRTQATYKAWESGGRRWTSIHSKILQIDEHGKEIAEVYTKDATADPMVEQRADPAEYVRTLEPFVYGCAHAFSPGLFQVFGRLPDAVIHEDNSIAFRSLLGGGVCLLREPLVRYRVHCNNIFISQWNRSRELKALERQEERLRRDFRNREVMHDTFLLDLKTARAKGLISSTEFDRATAEAERMRRRYAMMGKFLESGISAKFRILAGLRKEGLPQKDYKILSRRILPRPLLLRCQLLLGYAGSLRGAN